MTAIAIDRTRRHSIRKLAAMLAGLLVLGIATLAVLAAWSGSAELGSASSYAGSGTGQGLAVANHHAARSRVS